MVFLPFSKAKSGTAAAAAIANRPRIGDRMLQIWVR
jgi:hypothetical protein